MLAKTLLILTLLVLVSAVSRPAHGADCPEATEATALRQTAGTSDTAEAELARALADALDVVCDLARQRDAALAQVDDVQTDRDRQAMRGDLLDQRADELQRQLDARPSAQWSPPLWLVIPLRAVAVGATSAAAYSLARGLPPELTVGFAVGGLGALVVDVVLELISRPR